MYTCFSASENSNKRDSVKSAKSVTFKKEVKGKDNNKRLSASTDKGNVLIVCSECFRNRMYSLFRITALSSVYTVDTCWF